ncbi:MAG TPA: hypothetical protein VFS15_28945 [Kofleriaceae bacterium]|nr:hypothetical protein [Kofleriaceae bacterium]
MRDDQTSYRCRVRLRAATENSLALVSFRAALCPVGEGEETMYANDAASVASTGAISSTTHAWYDAASLLYLDTRLTARASRAVATIDSIGGDEISARWLRVQLSVWASYSWSGAAQSATPPRLSGVELDEYYTP